MKKGMFNFVWLFAIVAGGAILVLAIYGAVQAGDTIRFQVDTEIGKSISIITDPLQAGFAEGSFGRIRFQSESRINNICFDNEFGKNDISVATQSDIGEEWNLAGGATSIYNKYIFSSEKSFGDEYFVFSKPFEFPYEVSDLIFLTSDIYCFRDAPDEVVEEVEGLGMPNVEFDNCSAGEIRVCFGSGAGNCDVVVYGSDSDFEEGKVVKNSGDVYYVDSLMYGAIFSDKLIYNCNVERLLYRAGKIAEVLIDKADLMDARGCGTNLKGDLIGWRGMLEGSEVDDLISLKDYADKMDKKNRRELCGVW